MLDHMRDFGERSLLVFRPLIEVGMLVDQTVAGDAGQETGQYCNGDDAVGPAICSRPNQVATTNAAPTDKNTKLIRALVGR